MKTSIITDEMTQDLSVAVSFAHAYSLSGLELRTIDDLPLEKLSERRLREIRHILGEEGLCVCDIAGSFYKCRYSKREGEIEKLKRLIEAAYLLEAPSIRCFAFLSEEPVSLEAIADAYQKPLAMMTDAGKKLLLEADPSVMTTNHKALATLIDLLQDPAIGAIYDPGNDLYDPEGEIPYPDGFEAVKRHITHIHIKDAVRTENGSECVKIGSGSVGYDALMPALIRSGYDGFLSLETHYRAGRKISDSQMKLPGGSSFSEGGLAACEESMEALNRLLEIYGGR